MKLVTLPVIYVCSVSAVTVISVNALRGWNKTHLYKQNTPGTTKHTRYNKTHPVQTKHTLYKHNKLAPYLSILISLTCALSSPAAVSIIGHHGHMLYWCLMGIHDAKYSSAGSCCWSPVWWSDCDLCFVFEWRHDTHQRRIYVSSVRRKFIKPNVSRHEADTIQRRQFDWI